MRNTYWLFSLLICYLFFSSTLHAQSKTDSLLTVLDEVQDTHRIRPLLMLSQLLQPNYPDSGLHFALEATEIAQKRKHRKYANCEYVVARAYWQLADYEKTQEHLKIALAGAQKRNQTSLQLEVNSMLVKCYRRMGKMEESLALIEKTMPLANAQEDKYPLISLYNSRAMLNLDMGNIEPAKEAMRSSIWLSEKHGLLKKQAYGRNILAEIFRRIGQPDSAMYYYQGAVDLAIEIGDLTLEAGVRTNMGIIQLFNGEVEDAMRNTKRTLELAEQTQNKHLLQFAEYRLASIYRQQLAYDSALVHFERALEIAEQSGDKKFISILHYDIGLIFENRKQVLASIDHVIKSIHLAEAISFRSNLSSCYRTLASSYRYMGQFDQAYEYLEKAQSLDSANKEYAIRSFTATEMAFWYWDQDDTTQAMKWFKISHEYAEQSNSAHCRLSIYGRMISRNVMIGNLEEAEKFENKGLQMGDTLKQNLITYNFFLYAQGLLQLSKKNYAKSIPYFEQALAMNREAKQADIDEICYEGLAKAHEHLGNYRLAMDYQNQKIEIQDSLTNRVLNYQISQLQTQYETQKKEQEIVQLKNEQLTQELDLKEKKEELASSQFLLILLLVISVFGLVIGRLAFNRYKLQKNRAQLELENKRLHIENQNAENKRQLEIASYRTKLFTDTSHELRTPLTLIAGPIEQMTQSAQGKNKEQLQRVLRNTHRLVELVNQTLDIHAVDRTDQTITLLPLPLGNLAKNSVDSFQFMAESRGIELLFEDHSEGALLELDESKLAIVLTNLIGNAFKHTPDGGTIKVRVSTMAKSEITLQVWNNGRSIPEEEQDQIFQRHYQVNGHEPGHGIGLALSLELMEMHGGSIEVKSSPELGTSFICHFKQNASSQTTEQKHWVSPERPSPWVKPEFSGEKNRILVVEDHEDLRSYLVELLQEHYEVMEASNGKEGLRLAEDQQPDLVLSDVMMPEVEGIELTRRLKEQLATSHLPVVLLTAKGAHQDKMEGLESGADDYLVKPFHPDELIARIHNLIYQRKKLRERFSKNTWDQPEELVSNKVDEAFLTKARKIVEEQLSNPDFSVEMLCRALALNRNSVHQKMKALTGQSAQYFIRNIKLKKAASLLLDDRLAIQEVAEMAGFQTRQSFNKAFQAQFRMTPSHFRKSRQTQ